MVGAHNVMTPGDSVSVKRSRDPQFQAYPGQYSLKLVMVAFGTKAKKAG